MQTVTLEQLGIWAAEAFVEHPTGTPIGSNRDALCCWVRAFLARWDEIARVVHDVVREFGGSFSAEHGIGVMKRADLKRYKSPVEVDLMRALKRTLDPKNILNPGKLVPE